MTIKEIIKAHVLKVFGETKSMAKTAVIVGISRRTLTTLFSEWGMSGRNCGKNKSEHIKKSKVNCKNRFEKCDAEDMILNCPCEHWEKRKRIY